MGESQCPHCGHIVTGFEQQEFEHRACVIADLQSQLAAAREVIDAAIVLTDAFVDVERDECPGIIFDLALALSRVANPFLSSTKEEGK